MKRQLLSLGVMVLLLVAGSAYAQTVNLTANVPFDFIVNGRSMPAGLYVIRTVGEATSAGIHLKNTSSDEQTLVLPHAAEAANPSSESKLVFHRYGSAYFLYQIWREGSTAGSELPKSSREAELARLYGSRSVLIAAKLQ
jgi:hypothetical protein